jgi:ubiquinone/menaquinone biosynthesis C-methylase UbiE
MPTTDPLQRTIGRHFSEVAERYDSGRVYEKLDFWAQEALRLGRPEPGDRLLDLGCGTGLFTRSLAAVWPGPVVGCDPSVQMLGQATAQRSGEDRARVELPSVAAGKAERLPFSPRAFRCVFVSQAWHHFLDKAQAAREMLRVIYPGGVLMVKTYSHAQLRQKPAFAFFPEMLDSQLRAYTDTEEMKELLRAVGFAHVVDSAHNWEDYTSLEEYVDAAERRLYSMYSFLTGGERERGITMLRERIAREGNARIRNDDVNTLVVAYRGT